MDPIQAIELIKNAFTEPVTPVTWMDLGCGSGTFTKALSTLVGKGSMVYAIDASRSSLDKVPGSVDGVTIHKVAADFIVDELPAASVDGILMANSLHYVADKPSLIRKLSAHLKPAAALLVVEYDTNKANQWVPHPISFNELQTLLGDHDFESIKKIGQAPSVYHAGGMYAARIKKY